MFAGRSEILLRVEADLRRVAMTGQPMSQSTIFTGSRGLGKTVLLNLVRRCAGELGFVPVHVALDRTDAGVQRLVQALAEALAELRGPKVLWGRFVERLSQFSLEISAAGVVKASGTWSPHTQTIAREHLKGLLVDAARLARERHSGGGLVLTLDEVQDAPAENLATIALAVQDASSQDVALAVFGAGLSHTPEVVMAAASFAERFRYVALGRLEEDAALIALLAPAQTHQISWSPDAARLVLSEAGGSPYLIQLFANETWIAARPTGPGAFSLDHAQAGIHEATVALHSGLYRGRLKQASPLEQELLLAIARHLGHDGVAVMGEVAASMGRTTSQLSTARRRLIDKGLIESPGTNQITFTMPGFDRFLLEHHDEPGRRKQVTRE